MRRTCVIVFDKFYLLCKIYKIYVDNCLMLVYTINIVNKQRKFGVVLMYRIDLSWIYYSKQTKINKIRKCKLCYEEKFG
jgi:hypothetical protein